MHRDSITDEIPFINIPLELSDGVSNLPNDIQQQLQPD
jgi:hypothetical protein